MGLSFLNIILMSFIQPELRQQIQQNPQENYAVLITLKGNSLPAALSNKGKFVFADKIFSARISGQEIQSLADNTEIEAIETDREMGIL